MRAEHDAMMLVRADLCERLERLQSLSRPASSRDFAQSVGTIRILAAAYGLTPVVRLAEALERALAEPERAGGCPRSLYLDRLRDAIGCERIDDKAAEALLASVSIQLRA